MWLRSDVVRRTKDIARDIQRYDASTQLNFIIITVRSFWSAFLFIYLEKTTTFSYSTECG